MVEPTPEPKENAAIVVRPVEPPAIVEPPVIVARPIERTSAIDEPNSARKTIATIVVVIVVCGVWWVIEQRSAPPPAPPVKLPYPPVVNPAK